MNAETHEQPPPRVAGNWWRDLLSLYRTFRVCRFSLVVAIVGAVVFIFVPQGVEILRALGEESTFHILGAGTSFAVQGTAVILGALTWSLASWYTCRVLLYFDFSASRGNVRQPVAPWCERLDGWLRLHLPRSLGIAPLLILAAGLWNASRTYGDEVSGAPGWLRGYAIACVCLALLLYVFFIMRLPKYALSALSRGTRRNFYELDADTRVALVALAVVSLVPMVLFTVNAVYFGAGLGPGAVLLFSAASWVFWGGACVYIFEQSHVPLLTLALLWAVLCSWWNDNHPVRTLPPSSLNRPRVGQAFDAWHAQMAAYPQEAVHPLFIVATEGGGIRAAFWTATVLGILEDEAARQHLPDFAEHVFAISAVSGGSLGAAAFDAALADGPTGPITKQLQQLLCEDYLGPPLAAMLYPDLMQRLWPLPMTGLDRGIWLEKSWEQGGRNDLHNNRFAQNFNELWTQHSAKVRYLPALFLNGTSVESGQRIIASNFRIDRRFLDSIDASTKVAVGKGDNCDVPLSTAAHGSARFTYVSPAGRFPDRTHIVDGGYFENSGATTALEILRSVGGHIARENIRDVRPYIIMISNDPLSAPSGGRDLQLDTPATKLEQGKHQSKEFLGDLLAPVQALMNTRGAHDSYAQLALREAQDYQDVAYFGLSPSSIPLPLGWMLSGTSAQEMDGQAHHLSLVDGKDNPAAFAQVLKLLNGGPAPAAAPVRVQAPAPAPTPAPATPGPAT
jgi:hypothetical protein